MSRDWGTHRNAGKAKDLVPGNGQEQEEARQQENVGVTPQKPSGDWGHHTSTITARLLMPAAVVPGHCCSCWTPCTSPMRTSLLALHLYSLWAQRLKLDGLRGKMGLFGLHSEWAAKFGLPPKPNLYQLLNLVFERAVLSLRKVV